MIQIGVGAASCLGSVTDHQPSLLVSVSSVPTITIVFVRMKRRHTALVAAEPSITSLCAQAVSRKRERLTLATEYTHANLATYLRNEVLPVGWDVHTPSEGATGISQFPVAHANRTTHVKELSHLAIFLGGITVSEAEDQYNGHCETCAVYFTNEVVKLVNSAVKLQPSIVLDEAYRLLNKKLADLSWEDCVAEIFAAERSAREEMKHDQTMRKGRTAAMWASLSIHDTFLANVVPFLPTKKC